MLERWSAKGKMAESENGVEMKQIKFESHPAVRKHYAEAKAAGKCEQCQNPWHDGTCSCGKWGKAEEDLLKIIDPILKKILDEDAAKVKKQQEADIKKINASLKPVKELSPLWEED
jgi:restriction endonuclease